MHHPAPAAGVRAAAGAGLAALLRADPRFVLAVVPPMEATARTAMLQPHLLVVDREVDGQLDLPSLTALTAASPGSCVCVYTTLADAGAWDSAS